MPNGCVCVSIQGRRPPGEGGAMVIVGVGGAAMIVVGVGEGGTMVIVGSGGGAMIAVGVGGDEN